MPEHSKRAMDTEALGKTCIRTRGDTAIFVKRDGIVRVGFGFFNRSREFQHQYDGYNVMEVDDDTHLFGRYFNNRDNSSANIKDGNVGTFELHKIN